MAPQSSESSCDKFGDVNSMGRLRFVMPCSNHTHSQGHTHTHTHTHTRTYAPSRAHTHAHHARALHTREKKHARITCLMTSRQSLAWMEVVRRDRGTVCISTDQAGTNNADETCTRNQTHPRTRARGERLTRTCEFRQTDTRSTRASRSSSNAQLHELAKGRTGAIPVSAAPPAPSAHIGRADLRFAS